MCFDQDCEDCGCTDICCEIDRKNGDVCSWDEFKKEVVEMIVQPRNELHEKEWVFRGALKTHCLKTSLERFRRYSDIPWDLLPDVESQLIREVERKSFGLGIPLPPEAKPEKMWWVSLMQHYGAPTRLLDWTYSPYVAAYFALEKCIEQNGSQDVPVVWAVQYKWTRLPRSKFVPWLCTWEQIENSEPGALDFLFRSDVRKKPFVMQANTHYLHERSVVQQGVFLCPTDVSKPFMQNFRAMGNWTDRTLIKRFMIKNEDVNKAMADLQKMNIARHSLFPGFAGFAESLKLKGAYFRDLVKNRARKTLFEKDKERYCQ